MLKLSKTTSPQKLFDYDCVTLYFEKAEADILALILHKSVL